MIPLVKSVTFVEELVYQNSAPMVFLCDDFETYYCKSKLDNQDHDFLVYELIGSRLANYFGIATPAIAWVEFDMESIGPNFFQKNYTLEHGDILFGSKFIGPNDHLDKTGKFNIKNVKQFSKLVNPEDLLKITIMDVHLNNTDRNDENYNLLIQTEERKYYAIDHAEIFGGPALKERFTPKGEPVLGQKLLSAYLLKNVLKYLSFQKIDEIVEKYFASCNIQLANEIGLVFDSLPDSWTVSEGLKTRVLEYTLDENRLNLIKLLIAKRFHELKKKK
ncbi:MAG: HipA family kinase [Mongoliitalea sp.]